MRIDDLIAQLHHWKNDGYEFADKRGSHWSLSKSQDFENPYLDTYWVDVIHPDAEYENEYKWKEGKDYAKIECKIDNFRILAPNENVDGYMKIVVDLEPVDKLTLPDWVDLKEHFDVFMDWDFNDLVRVGSPIFSCSI